MSISLLQNEVLTLGNHAFRSKYSNIVTANEQPLSLALSRVIEELDLLLLEVLT